jgi:hypothetical protein
LITPDQPRALIYPARHGLEGDADLTVLEVGLIINAKGKPAAGSVI